MLHELNSDGASGEMGPGHEARDDGRATAARRVNPPLTIKQAKLA